MPTDEQHITALTAYLLDHGWSAPKAAGQARMCFSFLAPRLREEGDNAPSEPLTRSEVTVIMAAIHNRDVYVHETSPDGITWHEDCIDTGEHHKKVLRALIRHEGEYHLTGDQNSMIAKLGPQGGTTWLRFTREEPTPPRL